LQPQARGATSHPAAGELAEILQLRGPELAEIPQLQAPELAEILQLRALEVAGPLQLAALQLARNFFGTCQQILSAILKAYFELARILQLQALEVAEFPPLATPQDANFKRSKAPKKRANLDFQNFRTRAAKSRIKNSKGLAPEGSFLRHAAPKKMSQFQIRDSKSANLGP
jgi:hypothetical protein